MIIRINSLLSAVVTRARDAIVLAVVLGTLSSSAVSGDQFWRPDGHLTARLELRDAQEGFAGVSGAVWTVEQDGAYTVARFLNERVEAPYRTGRLTTEQLKQLAHVLATQDFLGLPTRLGPEPKVNPRRISLTFGSKTSTLVLAPGEDPTRAPAGDASHTRLITISEKIRTLVQGDSGG